MLYSHATLNTDCWWIVLYIFIHIPHKLYSHVYCICVLSGGLYHQYYLKLDAFQWILHNCHLNVKCNSKWCLQCFVYWYEKESVHFYSKCNIYVTRLMITKVTVMNDIIILLYIVLFFPNIEPLVVLKTNLRLLCIFERATRETCLARTDNHWPISLFDV